MLARPCRLLFVFALISVKAENPRLEVLGFCGTILWRAREGTVRIMTAEAGLIEIAVLDDYQGVALEMACPSSGILRQEAS